MALLHFQLVSGAQNAAFAKLISIFTMTSQCIVSFKTINSLRTDISDFAINHLSIPRVEIVIKRLFWMIEYPIRAVYLSQVNINAPAQKFYSLTVRPTLWK